MVCKLKIFTIYLVVVFFTFSVKGQENVVINYRMIYKKDSLMDTKSQKDFLLSTTSKSSFYYSYDKFKYDSATINKVMTELTPSDNFDFEFMVEKDYASNQIHKYRAVLNQLFATTVPANFKWKIENEKKMIDIYSVQKATLDYKGRKWEAWFTNEIPISDGPYVFNGLPGIILEMSDSNDNFHFITTSINKSKLELAPIMSLKPITVTEKQLNKVLLDHYHDPFRVAKQDASKAKWFDENGKEFTPDYRELTRNEQEAIRKYNNPIELTEAINYR